MARILGNIKTDIALVLAPTNTGRLTLTRTFGSEYTGGTTIGGGKLIAAGNPAGSSTGTGPVAVNNGGTLGGNGGAGAAGTGAITVASGGHIAPGLATGTTIGTLTALGAVSLGSGSRLDMDLGAPAPGGGTSDRLDLPNGTALTVPGAAASIGVNLSDPAGGAAGNGTYTLMSFLAGQYTGSSNASQFFTGSMPSPNSLNGATISYQLADDSNVNQNGNPSAATRVNMIVSGGPNALVWTGAVDGTWNVGTPASPFNFNNVNTASGSAFADNDNVTFDDNGGNTAPITIAAGGVQPNIVTINNSTSTYMFSGGDIKGSSIGGGGGLFLGGIGPVTIDSNYTAAGPIVSNKSGAGSATFNGAITAATSVTVNGGAVTLAGANTYTGDNTINGGSLTASGASATFGTGDVTVNGGSAVISAGVANAILDSATLTLLGGGAAAMADAGFINLEAGINEQIAALVLGNTLQATGTYGATGSAATNINDEYFSGLGMITVVSLGVPGDYNSNGIVDGADYVLWRNGGPLQNEVDNPGTVNQADAAAMADTGFINLEAGINEQIAALVLGNTPQVTGTYGATGSGATNISDEYFSGLGIITVASLGVPGDYNGNGVVDGADYVVWRNGGPLQNEVDNPGTVNQADYTAWRARFGNSGAGSGLGDSAAVPEPATLLLSLVMICFTLSVRRGKR